MKPKYIYLPFIPSGKNAVTIFPHIFWSKKRKGWLKEDIVVHEMYHWNEQQRWKQTKSFGLLQWLLKYIGLWFWWNLIKGLPSEEHPMEKNAYIRQREYIVQ